MTDFTTKQIQVSVSYSPDQMGYRDATVSIRNNSSHKIKQIVVSKGVWITGRGLAIRGHSRYSHDFGSLDPNHSKEDKVVNSVSEQRLSIESIYGTLESGQKFYLGYDDIHPKGTCFVTTAAYGNPHHPMVETFRSLRDEVLVDSRTGRKFIDWYNKNGPVLAAVVDKSSVLQSAARGILTPVALAIRSARKITVRPAKTYDQ